MRRMKYRWTNMRRRKQSQRAWIAVTTVSVRRSSDAYDWPTLTQFSKTNVTVSGRGNSLPALMGKCGPHPSALIGHAAMAVRINVIREGRSTAIGLEPHIHMLEITDSPVAPHRGALAEAFLVSVLAARACTHPQLDVIQGHC
jgi:hypothetical protein